MEDEPKRRGRPRKSADEKARVKVWVYLTVEEKLQLERRLRVANVSASRYLRNLLWRDGVFGEEQEKDGCPRSRGPIEALLPRDTPVFTSQNFNG